MGTKAIGLIISALFASMANGQGQDNVLYLSNAQTPQELQESATLVRAIADIQQMSVDSAQKKLTVHATPDKIALAQWLVNELNQPAQPFATHAYPLPLAGGDAARVFYVFAPTPQDLQETATNVRSLGDVKRVFVSPALRAIAVRDTPEKIAFAEWLVKDLNQPAQAGARHEYRPPNSSNDVGRVFYLTTVETPQQLQEIMTTVRSLADMQRIFQYTARKAINLRGTVEMVGLAEWLINTLDQPAQPLAKLEYQLPARGEVARIFYLTHANTPQEVQQIATSVRTAAYVQRIFVYSAQKALALRGTVGQVATAERLLDELSKSN
jgi:hypothetical protein